MAAIITRETNAAVTDAAGITNNNAPLTNTQLDQNFINLNNELAQKLPLSGGTITGDVQLSSETADGVLYLDGTKTIQAGANLKFNGTGGLFVGTTGSVRGSVRLAGNTSGYVELQAPTSSTNITFTLPGSDGLNGQVLSTNGTGSLVWINQSAGGGGGGVGSGSSTSRTAFTAVANQTTFSVDYAVGQVDVYMNGIKLIVGTEVTATTGNTVVLAEPAAAGDIIDVVVYSTQWNNASNNIYFNTGNVGVGNTNPASRLHVSSAATALGVGTVRIDGADGAATVNAPITLNAATDGATASGGSQFYIETRIPGGALTEKFRIDGDGNVGINNPSPTEKLDVVGNVKISGSAILSAGTANTLLFLNSNKETASATALTVSGSNLGVNNTSPQTPLDIKGVFRLTGSSSGYVGLQAATSGTNVTYTLPTSDGLNGQVLSTNGVGALAWVNQTAGGGGGGGGSGTSTSRTSFTATEGQTTFSLTYVVGQIDVYMNGSKLVVDNDFTATNGTTIVLATGARAGSVVEAVTYTSQWITTGSNLYYNTGNVGVGNTNPAARLHVSSAATALAIGTVRIDGADSTGTVNAPVTLNSVTDGAAASGGSQFYIETRIPSGALTEKFRIDGDGNVGIGTSSPNAKLEVNGNAILGAEVYRSVDTSYLRMAGGNPASTGANLIVFGSTHATAPGRVSINAVGVGHIEFSAGGGEKMRLDSSGNLGLGTVPSLWNSGYRAFDGGGAQATYFTSKSAALVGISGNYYNDTSGVDRYVANGFATRYYQIGGAHIWNTAPSGTAGQTINTVGGAAPAWNQAMTLNGSGNLGIGTISPAYKTHIASEQPSALGLYRDLDVTSVGAAGIFVELGARSGVNFIAGARMVGVLNNPATTGYLTFDTLNAGVLGEKMRLDPSGNLGIGVSPAGKLHVLGTNASTGYTVYFANGTAYQNIAGFGTADIGNGTWNWEPGTVPGSGIAQFYTRFRSRSGGSTTQHNVVIDGDLGIGTNSPSAKLHVYGTSGVNITLNDDRTSATPGLTFDNAINFTGYNGVSTAKVRAVHNEYWGSSVRGLAFDVDNTERMRLDSSGNLGIGTNLPASKLEVYNSAVNAAFVANTPSTWRVAQVRNDQTGVSGTAAGIAFVGRTDTQPAGIVAINGNTTGGIVSLGFLTVDGNQTFERMRLDSSGRLLVGTTSNFGGAGQFAIDQSGGSVPAIHLIGTQGVGGGGRETGVTFSVVTNDTGPAYGNVAKIVAAKENATQGNTAGYMAFKTTQNGGTLEERARITSAGNFIVGTQDIPSGLSGYVQVSVSSSEGGISINSTDTSAGKYARLMFTKNNATGNEGLIRYNVNDYRMEFFTNGTEKACITSGGDLLVGAQSFIGGLSKQIEINGTNSAGLSLLVNGLQKGYWYAYSAAMRCESGNGTNIEMVSGGTAGVVLTNGATSWGSLSDERKKDIIEPITDAASKVSTLRAVIGKYKTDDEGTRRSFLIAQDVQGVLPEAVVTDSAGDLILQYTEIIPLLVAAIKEQQAIITALTARVQALEA